MSGILLHSLYHVIPQIVVLEATARWTRKDAMDRNGCVDKAIEEANVMT